MSKNKKSSKNPLRWVVGIHSCREALLSHPQWVEEVAVQDSKDQDLAEFEELSKKKSLKFKFVGKKFLNNIAESHQGVAVALSDRPRWDDKASQKQRSLVVFLDGITDPHNLGAILRTAWLLEVDGIFIPKERSVDLTPIACKVASGGAEHVPIDPVHFGSQLDWFKKEGYWIFGLSEEGKGLLPQVNFPEKTVLIVGAEDKGLRASTAKFCDELIQIPQTAGGSSYNASVAFAISAYECTRSRHL